ncbi:MAG: tetratricopeptide repeat protein [Planctomycetota bacterium]
MALFRRKSGEPPEDDNSGGKPEDDFSPQPDKARTWFEYARTAADSYNYEYALTCYANGIRLDPEPMSAHEAMFSVALQYCNSGGKPASSKEIRQIGDTHPVTKFAAAEFAWMKDIHKSSLAVKALEAAVKAEQLEYGNWIAPRVLNLLARAKKMSKSGLLQAKDLFTKVGAWNEAIRAGELAYQIDPTDNTLAAEIKDLAAQRAMDQGGYEAAAGKEGGFREFVRDADRQRELIEDEAITQSESAEERLLARARAEYENNPDVPDILGKYAQLLKKSGDPEAEQEAHRIYVQGFEKTGEYRFRMAAGDIRIDQQRRAIRALHTRLEESPADDGLQAQLDEARKALLRLQAEEYEERVQRYPTDRRLKYEHGLVLVDLERFDDAMAQFQAAKDEPKLRVAAGYHLGRCFAAEGWHREAIGEYKEALGSIEATEKELELTIRYDLMVSLMGEARVEKSIELAREALDICSSIARRDITFRDIRNRRKELDQLLKELGG